MAEFQKIVNGYQRICSSRITCDFCPLNSLLECPSENFGIISSDFDWDEFENRVLKVIDENTEEGDK